jgi:DNA binding domain, excisionase family
MPYIAKDEETLLTFAEVMTYLSISRTTLYRLLKDNQIPSTKVGGTYRFYLNDVREYVAKESSGGMYQQGYKVSLYNKMSNDAIKESVKTSTNSTSIP